MKPLQSLGDLAIHWTVGRCGPLLSCPSLALKLRMRRQRECVEAELRRVASVVAAAAVAVAPLEWWGNVGAWLLRHSAVWTGAACAAVCRFARQNHILCVEPRWIDDCKSRGCWMDEAQYLVVEKEDQTAQNRCG
jgi:hypothetical protein